MNFFSYDSNILDISLILAKDLLVSILIFMQTPIMTIKPTPSNSLYTEGKVAPKNAKENASSVTYMG